MINYPSHADVVKSVGKRGGGTARGLSRVAARRSLAVGTVRRDGIARPLARR